MMAAAMMSTGYTMVSADDFSDQEVQAEVETEDFAVDFAEEPVVEDTQDAEVQIEEEAQADESEVEIAFEDEAADAFSDGTAPEDFTENAEAEVEMPSYKTDFYFENDEVIITANVSVDAELPENAEIKVEKLEAGTVAQDVTAQSEDGSLKSVDINF